MDKLSISVRPLNSNSPELLESLKLPGGQVPPPLNLPPIIPMSKLTQHYTFNFKS